MRRNEYLKLLHSLLLIFTIGSPILCQQTAIEGMILDAETTEPIAFASIFLQRNNEIGTLSNELGEFSILIDTATLQDTLVVSYLGYKTTAVPFLKQDSILVISLQKTLIELDEIVVISDIGLRKIISTCMESIAENYGSDNHTLEAYFRRYTTSYGIDSHMKEGFFTIADNDYHTKKDKYKTDFKIWMHHYRESDDTRGFKFLDDTPKTNYLFTQYKWYNLMRNHALSWLDGSDKAVSNYSYSYMGSYVNGLDTIIRIKYALTEKMQDKSSFLFTGEYLINTTDNAIVRVQMGQDREDFTFDLVYQKYQGKYYPERMLLILGLGGGEGANNHWLNSLLYFYKINKGKKERKKGKRVYPDTPIDAKSVVYDEDFWNTQSQKIALPSSGSLELAVKELKTLEEQYKANAKKVIKGNQ